MSGYTNLLLRLQEVERALADANTSAQSALEYAREDEHELAIWLDCRGIAQHLAGAKFNLEQALRHLEEEDHA